MKTAVTHRSGERGAALLAVLLLVVLLSTIVIAVMDDLRFAIRRLTNTRDYAQAEWYVAGAEQLSRQIIWKSWNIHPGRSTLNDPWAVDGVRFATDGGSITGSVRDGGNCFNLNSVVDVGLDGRAIVRPAALEQFETLSVALGLDRDAATALAAALTDWIDSDGAIVPRGAEDAAYMGQTLAYRTGGTLLAHPSELRAIRGFSEKIYRRLRPYVCALPVADLSRINVNTLTPDQAPLVVMLTGPALSMGAARRVIESRPASGYARSDEFWSSKEFAGLQIADETRRQAVVATRFYALRAAVKHRAAELVSTSLIHLSDAGTLTLVSRRLSDDE